MNSMREKFKSFSKTKKWVIGGIAVLIFPITLMLILAELAINGFKEGKILKLVSGVFALLIVIGIFFIDDQKKYEDLYNEQKVELDETISELSKVESKLKIVNDELKDKSKVIDESKIYVELNDDEKSRVSEFINQMKQSENEQSSNIESKENTVSTIENKNISSNNNVSSDKDRTNNSSSNNNISNTSNSSNNANNSNISLNNDNNVSSSNSNATAKEGYVYANGGSSKSNKYHSSPTAHNMEGAIQMTKSEAESRGYVACKRCY